MTFHSQKQNEIQPWPDFRFNLSEVAGAVADYSTLLPIVVAVAVTSNLNLGVILLCFGFWYILTGLYYKLPIPVEPMKVIAAVVIAEGLSQKEIAASGFVIGVIFLICGSKKIMSQLRDKIPKELIRGIQLGLALILFKTSFKFFQADWVWGGIAVFIIIFINLMEKKWRMSDISALILLMTGLIISCFRTGLPTFTFPAFPGIIIPNLDDILKGSWILVLPQIPLTVTNAILATSLLFSDLLKREVDPDRLSKTIGWMNLTVAPLGGFPMCHGAGGLAAQYRFGARTGMSNIISGVLLIPMAFYLAQPGFIQNIPSGIFGALLVFIAWEITKHGLKTRSLPVTGTMGLAALFTNMTLAFLVGLGMVWWLKRRS